MPRLSRADAVSEVLVIPVTAVMIAYNNEDKSIERLQRDLLPALALPALDAELIVIDNSATTAQVDGVQTRYQWQLGKNLMYGPALNLAVDLARHPYLLYVCTNHGHARDVTWSLDLLAPLIADRTVAMTGSLADSGRPENAGFSPSLPRHHIQGGVFAARVDLLREHPYPEGDHECVHWGADIFECFQLMKTGYMLLDVPTVRSVWRASAGEGSWKYVHEEDPLSDES